ncbi:hypothetical protein Pmani_011271 [Petrolisthes manimaculis]|uniref:RNA cytidine acetyltransferase n=1 Tax=Petrolisthes manimaculis TaxID=1843537 RepID=A0AAE1PZX8_9EUCA|nr:hypothetical protein Pmani_011271 [Petrolisthes manimaculis]
MVKVDHIAADTRLKSLIENNGRLKHRSFLAILGNDVKQQVMVIHHLISKALGERPSVLWCHKRDSDVPRQSRKQLKKLEKNLKSGKCDISKENAFDVFMLSTGVKYCCFNDSQSILGNTYGMCVIQDFEGVTANTLCRITETVSGGGAVVLLLPGMNSLRCLSSLKMDIHSRLKTHSHPNVTPLFNERFVVSLSWCKSFLVLDSKLQLVPELPTLNDTQVENCKQLTALQTSQTQLEDLRNSLNDAEKPLPQLVSCCWTLDQAKAVLKMIDVLTEKGGRGTVSLTAGRGRGKSAALGLAVAAAVHFSLNNIFVTSPAPTNLATFFEFLFKGFDALGYQEQSDYEIIQSTNAEFGGAIVRVSVFREYRQIIQYVEPTDCAKLSQAELLVIDEAAAIPLPHVKALIGGPYNVIMSSTITGYEGTGRSLSLKLLQQLREQAVASSGVNIATTTSILTSAVSSRGRTLHELTLSESVRYSPGDPVESWLYRLLCLDTPLVPSHTSSCPPPQNCSLYYVNRSVLLSGHNESEHLLSEIMSLLAASHYRNSPDDLQILSDAPAHSIFVLLPPVYQGMESLPPVLAVVQVCLEGGIPSEVSEDVLRRGERPGGDLVPWTLASQFLSSGITSDIGLRIVRVAAHPDYQSMGYGSRAINLLKEYYSGQHVSLEEKTTTSHTLTKKEQHDDDDNNTQQIITPRKTSEPLLLKLSERLPESVDYLSVSYGLTLPLLRFWSRAGYLPLYISQVQNKTTGEHSCMMVNPLNTTTDDLTHNTANNNNESCSASIKTNSQEFLRRFKSLLGGPLSDLHPMLALGVIQAHANTLPHKEVEWNELRNVISGHDLMRLERYSKNLADRHLIADLLTSIATLFFLQRLPNVHLSPLQSGLLVGMGLQLKSLDEVIKSLDLAVESALGQFNRAIRRLLKAMTAVQEAALAKHLPKFNSDFVPVSMSLDQDLEQAAEDYEQEAQQKKKQEPIVKPGLLGSIRKYTIKGSEEAWQSALQEGNMSTISVKSTKRPAVMTEKELEDELTEPKPKKQKKGKGKKDRKR